MAKLTLVYLIASFLLVVVAVLIHIRNTSLSLPTSPVVSVITIILPIVASLNALFHSQFLRKPLGSPGHLNELTPFILQILQALVTTILATLLFEDVAPSSVLECKLDKKWMDMFRAHDISGIRSIQDAFNCCGLNSIKDRAYPFPNTTPSTCAEMYGRTLACREPWKSSMQKDSGVALAVVVMTGLVQVIRLFFVRRGTPWWSSSQQRHHEQTPGEQRRRRPLLTAGSGEDEESGRDQENGSRGYGTVSRDTPRVEPSSMGPGNAWAN